MTLSMRIGLTLLFYQFTTVQGGYELRVRAHEYNNPTGTCQEGCLGANQTHPACCDDPSFEPQICTGFLRCDTYFVFCQRPLETPANNVTCPDVFNLQVSNFIDDSGRISFTEEEVAMLQISNPLLFTGDLWQGVQFYAVVMDKDTHSSDELVDVYAIDVEIPAGLDYTDRVSYRGYYGFSELELSFQVICSETFYGPNCTFECVPTDNNDAGHFTCDSEGNPVCLTGFTGLNCMDGNEIVTGTDPGSPPTIANTTVPLLGTVVGVLVAFFLVIGLVVIVGIVAAALVIARKRPQDPDAKNVAANTTTLQQPPPGTNIVVEANQGYGIRKALQDESYYSYITAEGRAENPGHTALQQPSDANIILERNKGYGVHTDRQLQHENSASSLYDTVV